MKEIFIRKRECKYVLDALLIFSIYDFVGQKGVPHPLYKHPRIKILVLDGFVSNVYALQHGHSAILHLKIRHRHLRNIFSKIKESVNLFWADVLLRS